jgi:hypothetical protein
VTLTALPILYPVHTPVPSYQSIVRQNLNDTKSRGPPARLPALTSARLQAPRTTMASSDQPSELPPFSPAPSNTARPLEESTRVTELRAALAAELEAETAIAREQAAALEATLIEGIPKGATARYSSKRVLKWVLGCLVIVECVFKWVLKVLTVPV